MNRFTEFVGEYVDLLRGGASINELKAFLEDNGLLYGHWSRRDKLSSTLKDDYLLVEVFGKERRECIYGHPMGSVDTDGIIVDDLYDELYTNPNYRDNPDPKWPPMGTFSRLRTKKNKQSFFKGPTVFLCHAKEDKEQVRRLCNMLESEGINPWFDEKDIMPGDDWELVIRRAIKQSDAIIVCMSQKAVNKTGFIQKEIRFALDRADELPEGKRYIIPVLFESCSIPERLQKWQYINLADIDSDNKLLVSLKNLSKKTI